MKRRDFLGFFLIGGLVALFRKAVPFFQQDRLKKAMFWRKA